MEADTCSSERRKPRARTGAPHCASTALVPTARINVLFPAMFGPLMISSRRSGPRHKSLRTACSSGLAHPLVPEEQAVRNDLCLGPDLRLLIISGPNMAGKSTFIRAVGTNAVLAQCGAPVRARGLRLSLLQVSASICLLDSLQGGVSRFYAEITRLKLIAELTKKPLPVLFLLDELLNGTNSHDRRIGAEAVVKSLVEKGAVGLVTTHDLALTLMVEEMKGQAA